jgi:hypothetical protein
MHKTTTLYFQSIVIGKICCTIIFLLTPKQPVAKNPITPSNPIKIVAKNKLINVMDVQ